jgi:hypothetical protein
MSKNVPITFVWMSLVQDHDWPERSTEKKIPSRVQIVAVAFVLMRHADADGQNVYPAVGTVAELAGVSLATVRNVYGVMRGEGFLRPDGNGRHRTLKYRLIYPSLSSQIDPAGSISTTKSRQTTNRTELPSAHSSPDGDIVAPSANTERSVSVLKVEVDLVDLERSRLEFLRPFFECGERVSYPETRYLSREFSDQGLEDEWCDFTRTEVFSDFQHFLSKSVISCSYTDVVEVMSGESTDENQISDFCLDSVLENMAYVFESTLEMFVETYCLWRSEKESGWMVDWKHEKSPSMNAIGWDLDFGYEPPESSNGSMELMSFSYLAEVVEDLMKKMDDSRVRVMAIRANAGSVSVSATNTGSDRMIVEKIVETVSEKVDVKDVERW